MSISSIGQSNILGHDVLQMIFQHLDAKNLLKCEAVCRQWRNILLAGTPWRRLYHRNIVRLPQWRRAQKILKSNPRTLRTEQYRGFCIDLIQQVNTINRNLRRGHFAKLTYPVSSYCATNISISHDYVAWNFYRSRKGQPFCHILCAFLDTESTEIKEIPFPDDVTDLNEMLVTLSDLDSGKSEIEIVDPKNRWVVNVSDRRDEQGDFLDFKFVSKLLVTYYGCEVSDVERIRIWKMGNPPVLLHDHTCKFRNLYLVKVDEQFMVLCNFTTLYFISTETLEEFRTLSWEKHYYEWIYDRGLLFQSFHPFNGIIRIFDVASGTFFKDVCLPFRNNTEGSFEFMNGWASSNSSFVVIGWKDSTMFGTFSHLSFYDLEAVKKPSSNRRCYLYTLQFQFELPTFVMDESRIAFKGYDGNHWNVTVLNFADLVEQKTSDLEDKPETQMKIIFDPYVDYLPLNNTEVMET